MIAKERIKIKRILFNSADNDVTTGI